MDRIYNHVVEAPILCIGVYLCGCLFVKEEGWFYPRSVDMYQLSEHVTVKRSRDRQALLNLVVLPTLILFNELATGPRGDSEMDSMTDGS